MQSSVGSKRIASRMEDRGKITRVKEKRKKYLETESKVSARVLVMGSSEQLEDSLIRGRDSNLLRIRRRYFFK